MLAEDEWQRLSPLMDNMVADIRRHQLELACGLSEATAAAAKPALDVYEEITGFRETNLNALHHHRLSLYGPPCGKCAKPLRTPRARYCAMCDWRRPGEPAAQAA